MKENIHNLKVQGQLNINTVVKYCHLEVVLFIEGGNRM